ncbi:MAG TPA: hypothetical protein QF423_02550 [Candidatus Scalindua sp.]|jgi:hypothetical protein|nr:hypothetical protein [Candidatus Scalindua sp.]
MVNRSDLSFCARCGSGSQDRYCNGETANGKCEVGLAAIASSDVTESSAMWAGE